MTLAPRTPLRPAPGTRPAQHLIRAAAASLAAVFGEPGTSPERAAKKLFGNDEPTLELLTRAATGPATTTTSGWAAAFAVSAVADFIGSGPVSASGTLISRGLRADLDGVASLLIPEVVASAAAAGSWITEGSAIPVRALSIGQTQLGPMRKVACLGIFTSAVARASAVTVESVTRQVMSEATGLALDAALFSADADDGAKPQGLLYGLTGLTPTSGGSFLAMETDLAALAGAVNSATWPILLIGAPAQAARLMSYSPTNNYSVVASAALAPGTVVAVGTKGFISAFDPVPKFDTSDLASLVMRDDAGAVSTAGSPNAVSAPVISLWQHDMVGLRMILRAAWARRSSDSVAFVEDTTW